jgi:hypothetical protein
MWTDFRISSLVPSGLVFDGVSDSTDSLILAVRSRPSALCARQSRAEFTAGTSGSLLICSSDCSRGCPYRKSNPSI